ncbi:3845_t:CDS:2, partial [Scutellospora calospora]
MAGTSDPSSANLDMSNSSVNNETIENSMFKKMFDEYRAKDEQISRLTVEIEELKRENLKLKAQQSVKMPEQSINIRNCDPKQKAQELKNALNKVHPNRPHYVNRQQLVPSSTAIIPHVDVNHSLVDIDDNISKNTNNVPISHAPPLLNSSFMSHEPPIPEYQVRPSNDQEVINQATTPLISHFTPLSDGRLSYPPLPQSPPRRTNNSNKPDKPSGYSQAKHTIFIAWTGSMTLDGLKSLFRTEDVDDIRFLPNKQFAHVDLKTEAGLKRALELNDQ